MALSEKNIGASVPLGAYEETASLSLLEAIAPVAIPAKHRMQFVIARCNRRSARSELNCNYDLHFLICTVASSPTFPWCILELNHIFGTAVAFYAFRRGLPQ